MGVFGNPMTIGEARDLANANKRGFLRAVAMAKAGEISPELDSAELLECVAEKTSFADERDNALKSAIFGRIIREAAASGESEARPAAMAYYKEYAERVENFVEVANAKERGDAYNPKTPEGWTAGYVWKEGEMDGGETEIDFETLGIGFRAGDPAPFFEAFEDEGFDRV